MADPRVLQSLGLDVPSEMSLFDILRQPGMQQMLVDALRAMLNIQDDLGAQGRPAPMGEHLRAIEALAGLRPQVLRPSLQSRLRQQDVPIGPQLA